MTKHNSANGGVYLISQADRFNDVGEYQCIAENSLGAVLSNKAKLTVACKFHYLVRLLEFKFPLSLFKWVLNRHGSIENIVPN